MRGRKPKPSYLKILAGNPGRRPLNNREPQPTRKTPACPGHLDREARIEWRRICKELDKVGLLTLVDRAVVAGYCQAWSRWVRAENMLRESGEVLESAEGGRYQNPWLAVANKALEQVHKFSALLGLDPSSRSRLKASPSAPANDDPAERYFA
jgi:P27 family predicted phage terminase small subunit